MITETPSTVAPADAPAPAAATAPAAPRVGLGTFASLRHKDFRLLWSGTLFMSAGQWIQQVTLGWLIYDMTGSSVLLGALNAVRTVPFLVTGPLGGVAADRFDRRHLLMITQAMLFLTAFTMGTLVANGWVQVWHLFAFALVAGLAWSFNQPVRQTLVPALVPRDDLMNAIALNSVGFNITKVIGPTLGGLLIASFGAGGNFFVQGSAYLCVLLSLYFMTVPRLVHTGRRASALTDLREGIAYVRGHPLLLALVLTGLIPNIFAMPYNTLLPVFQKDVYNAGPEALGLLLAAPGIGAVISTLGLASVAKRLKRKGLLLIGALLVLGTSLIIFAQSPSLPLALSALPLVGGCQILFGATTNTMIQLIVPDALRGRVVSIYMLDIGMVPLGAMLAGFSSAAIGPQWTVTWMGSLVIVLALGVAVLVPQVRNVEL